MTDTITALRDAFAKAEKERDEAIAHADALAEALDATEYPDVVNAYRSWKAAR